MKKQGSYIIQAKQLNDATMCDRILKLRNFKKKTFIDINKKCIEKKYFIESFSEFKRRKL
jgi:hypothetical protein